MYQQGGTIKKVLDNIASNKYVLPAIQREFVWSPEQICKLFDSVMQGYPFGEFLFWRIQPERSADYRYYGFVREYHQRDNPHCPDLGPLPNQEIIAVLDGQQRMTAFNIGLRGSMSVKRPYKWWNSPDAFPLRVLALDLLAKDERDEEGNLYSFDFVDIDKIGQLGERLWFRVSDILDMEPGPDMHEWLLDKDLEKQNQIHAHRILDCLYRMIHMEPTVAYYEENNPNIEHVLSIFIRRNSGGTTLSYSDLLLSIATSQWSSNLDARKEVHQLVDDLNRIGPGLDLTKDFVLKAGLMLTDIASVGFQVRNFTRSNMAILEKNWQRIRDALVETSQLVTGFGFDANSIRAASALLPIAYYLYQIGTPRDFDHHSRYEDDRNAIRGWLIRSVLKASGIWGSGLDTLLTALREVLRDARNEHFPAAEMRRLMAQRGKSLEFSEEEVEDLADMGLNDRRIFALLAMLSPFIDFQHHHFHIDHIFPKSRFTPKRLQEAGIDENQIDILIGCANRIGNLQLLDGAINLEKQATLPADWIEAQFPTEEKRRHYRDLYLLGEIPRDLAGFLDFYEARQKRLQARISELVNSV
ncbi:MAG: DUF262 domain-containing protein [Gammaproteobacteria bacterium]|nr:DUF262 domain-containing protein [Gammaproteobacteria bacterium]